MSSVFKEKLLQGKVAFVTGGSSGINLRIAERFAEHAAKVVILGRKQEKLDEAEKSLRARGAADVMTISADVRDFAAVDAAFQKVHDAWGDIDVVVAGAAGNFPAPAAALSSNGFKAVVEIDLQGTFHAYRAAFERLRKPGASLISISANQAYQPTPFQAHVCAAKAGVDMLTKTIAFEWGPQGVRANCITPGPIDDTEGMRRLTPSEEAKDALLKTLPLRRYGSKDEIADLALFLASPAASYVTGANFVCDGGQSLGGSGAFASAMGL
jgi:NAD(P)-dependent dehydrogenase (short-subunit alcohol dehydrogenase family)